MTVRIYVLEISKERCEELLKDICKRGKCVEGVLSFDHSRSSPLVVLISTKSGMITHIADGRKSNPSSTNRTKLNMFELSKLDNDISYDEISLRIRSEVRRYAEQKFRDGGLVPHATSIDMADVIMEMDSSLADRLRMLSSKRMGFLKSISDRENGNLAVQKDCVGTALDWTGISREALFGWDIREDGMPRSVLEGLSGCKTGEDVMLAHDWANVPEFHHVIRDVHASSRVFVSDNNPELQLTVTMANRTDLEMQTGADLIYCNDTYRNFVMVQYKAMERNEVTREAEFRWRKGDQFTRQISIMDNVLQALKSIPKRDHPGNFRFSYNPFFFKFYPRVNFDPDNKEIAKGMYLPLDYWKSAERSGQFIGPSPDYARN